jgi:regulator of sigma D
MPEDVHAHVFLAIERTHGRDAGVAMRQLEQSLKRLNTDRLDEQSLCDYASDGRFELYKTSAEHEGEAGRKQHGFPSQEEVAM